MREFWLPLSSSAGASSRSEPGRRAAHRASTPLHEHQAADSGNGQFGIKGQAVNVPIDVSKVVRCLPRMVPEDVAFDVHIKRRLMSPATYKRGLVKRGNVLAWLKHVEHSPLYRAINVRVDWSRLDHFDDGGEREEPQEDDVDDADGEFETIPEDFDVNDPLQLAVAFNAVSKTLLYNEAEMAGVGKEKNK